MDFNTILMLIGAAVLILPVVYMLGYARREQQHGKTVKDCEENVTFQRNTLVGIHREEVTELKNIMRELEISLLQAGEAIELRDRQVIQAQKNWKYADKFRKAIVQTMLDHNLWNFNRHGADPTVMLNNFADFIEAQALDPQVSQKAKNLHTRGVRKGAAMGRKQMAKLMQKSIDNQTETIQQAWTTIAKKDNVISEQATEHEMYREAVRATLDDKIALPGVRKSIKQAICVELDRMKAVDRFLKD